jgi:hypothetical protein
MSNVLFFNYDVSLFYFIESFCNQEKFTDVSFSSVIKENILSQLFSYNFDSYKGNHIKNQQQNLLKNEFLMQLGDKISLIIGLLNNKKYNSSSINNINLYLSFLQIASQNIPNDLKIFLSYYNNNMKKKNWKNKDLIKSQISFILFIFKKFKSSAYFFMEYYSLKFNKNPEILINKKFFFDWLKNLNSNNLWSKINILKIYNLKQKQSVIQVKNFIKKQQNFKKFSTMILNCRQKVLFLVHRHTIFKIYKKLIFFENFSYVKNIYLNHVKKRFKIFLFSNFICKELYIFFGTKLKVKFPVIVHEISIERILHLNFFLTQNLTIQLSAFFNSEN